VAAFSLVAFGLSKSERRNPFKAAWDTICRPSAVIPTGGIRNNRPAFGNRNHGVTGIISSREKLSIVAVAGSFPGNVLCGFAR